MGTDSLMPEWWGDKEETLSHLYILLEEARDMQDAASEASLMAEIEALLDGEEED